MRAKTAVTLTMAILIILAILLGVSSNLKGWSNVITNMGILLVMLFLKR